MTDSDQAQPLPDPQAEPTGVLPPEPARSGRRGLGERLSGPGALIGTGLGALALGLVLGGAGGFAIGHADGWDRPPGLHQGFDAGAELTQFGRDLVLIPRAMPGMVAGGHTGWSSFLG